VLEFVTVHAIRQRIPQREAAESTLDLRLAGVRSPMPQAIGRKRPRLFAHLQGKRNPIAWCESPEGRTLGLTRGR